MVGWRPRAVSPSYPFALPLDRSSLHRSGHFRRPDSPRPKPLLWHAVGRVRGEGGGRPDEALLGAEEVAAHFGVTTTTVYRGCKEGRVPCMKIGRLWRVRREALEHFPKKIKRG